MLVPGRPRVGIPPYRSRLRSLRWQSVPAERLWAECEFGHAQLGDARLTRRLVTIASAGALAPQPFLTQIFATVPNDLRRAYAFFGNELVSAYEIAAAHHLTTARQARGQPFVFLSVDGSSLAFDAQGVGRLGSDEAGGKGLKTMLALAVGADGVPLGLMGQVLWARGPKARTPHARRALADKETKRWHEVIDQAQEMVTTHAPGTRLWVQADRDADSWTMLREAVDHAHERWTTIRSKANRNLAEDPDGQDDSEPGGKLRPWLESQPEQAIVDLTVSGGPSRKARTAKLSIRWAEVTLKLADPISDRTYPAPLYALLAREVGTTPRGEKPIEWLLLTTFPIATARDACQVLFGYSQRWPIETFHAAFKDRGLRLEDSELDDAQALKRWAAVSFALAARVMRLVYLGRHQPDLPATVELTALECRALVFALRQAEGSEAGMTIEQAMVGLGKLGGHVGDPKKRPIGYEVMMRGVRVWGPMVGALEAMEERRGREKPS